VEHKIDAVGPRL